MLICLLLFIFIFLLNIKCQKKTGYDFLFLFFYVFNFLFFYLYNFKTIYDVTVPTLIGPVIRESLYFQVLFPVQFLKPWFLHMNFISEQFFFFFFKDEIYV